MILKLFRLLYKIYHIHMQPILIVNISFQHPLLLDIDAVSFSTAKL